MARVQDYQEPGQLHGRRMNTAPCLASCRTGRGGATLSGRFHWFACGRVHLHTMPRTVVFFKGFPRFHRRAELFQEA